MNKRWTRWICWCGVAALLAGIFLFSAQTAAQSSGLSQEIARRIARLFVPDFSALCADCQTRIILAMQHPLRKAAHAFVFFLLGGALMLTAGTYSWRFWLRFVFALGLSLVFAALDETHQLYVDGRGGRVADVLIDGAGALTGTLLIALFQRRRARVSK